MTVITARQAGTIGIGDLTVPRLGYGTMRLTGPRIFGPPADRDEAVRVVRRAVDLGVRVVDTAWYYGPDVANEIVAEALYPYPDDLALVTKLGGARRPDASWYSALTDHELREGCERDLRQLRIESVPVVHLRWMEGSGADLLDALGTLVALRDEGKVQRIGLSNVDVDQVVAAREHVDVVTVSNSYSVLDRTNDDLVEFCAREGIAFLPFFPLGASPVRSGAGAGGLDSVTTVAQRHGATAVQVALAWLMHRSPALLPIPGTSRVPHLEENVAAAGLTLTERDLAELG